MPRLRNKARFDAMREFFDGVGEGDTAGVWDDTPQPKTGIPRALPEADGGARQAAS